MGKRGPAAKPTALKKREGTYRADRASKCEPMPVSGAGPMPTAITKDKTAKSCWEHLAPLLLTLRVMTVADWLVFAGLCRSYSIASKADAHIARRGVIVRTPWGDKSNPAVSMSRLAWIEVRKFAAEFGLSPASRSRVNSAPGEGEKDQAEEFLFGNDAKVVGSIGSR